MFGYFRALGRLSRLEEDFRKLRHEHDLLELEWSETLSKVKKAMGRAVKSEAIIRAREAQEAGEVEVPIQASLEEGPLAGRLTPRQKAIQQEILRRRAGLGGNSRALLPG